MNKQDYIRAVREFFRSLPNTHSGFSRSDRALAAGLYHRAVPLDSLFAAMLLATARRCCRVPAARPLPPIRSLHYFLPTLAEIQRHPLPTGYLRYLQTKIQVPVP